MSASSSGVSPRPDPGGPPPVVEEEDDEELECRVCREGRSQGPLLRPCRCAGSIMYAHQDCLLQWLRHSGKDACELCKHRFAFRPVYAPDAPAQVPTAEVAARCLRKAVCEYLPFGARLLLAGALWLGVVPCTTSWVFRIWIRRASFLVPDLVRRRVLQGGGGMLWNDVVSGIIIAAFIIFSFLSLMSFADFLRFHWDVRDENLGGQEEEAAAIPHPPQHLADDDEEEEDAPLPHQAHLQVVRPPTPTFREPREMRQGLPADFMHPPPQEEEDEEEVPIPEDDIRGRDPHRGPTPPRPRGEWQEEFAEEHQAAELLEDYFDPPGLAQRRREQPQPPAAAVAARNGNEQQQAQAQAQAQAQQQPGQEDADVELHVAVDELLGVRGPFPFLLRNILWLLAFNGAYLGLFAFIPYSVGAAVVGAAEKYADTPPLRLLLQLLVPAPMCQLAVEASRAAAAEDHTLQLPDLGVILLGYLMMSAMVFTWRAIVCAVCQRAGRALPLLWGRVVRVLEGTAAVVKVGLLLSLKMLTLPLLLGLWLDAATQPILGPPFAQRVRFATENLVGALLLHWVAGISFMLVVTVSVLQLREVLHPDLLARIIRPQEPQPDLLGSLLQEPGLTHARRMVMSLAIYVALLVLFVWLPARALPLWLEWGPEEAPSKLFQLRTCYLAPQLQIPLELILFHLAMLAFLEHTKTGIGRLQHLWLRPLCAGLGLTRFLLPLPRRARPKRGDGTPYDIVATGRWEADPDDPENHMIGRIPIRRPPAPEEWEEGGAVAEGGERQGDRGRWAWGNEPPTLTERVLAPRRRPRFCLLRLALLLVLSWAAVLVLVVGAGLLPLLLGRAVFALTHIPPRFGHDPLAFAIGCAICWGAHKWALRLQQRIDRTAVELWKERYRQSQPTLRQLWAVAAFLLAWAVASPLLLGLLFELALVTGTDAWRAKGLAGLHWGQDWVLGVWILHELVYLGYLGVLDRVWGPYYPPGAAPAQPPQPATYQAALCHTLSSLQAVFLRWEWDKATEANLLHPFALPLFNGILEATLLPTAVAVALPLLRAHYPALVMFLPSAEDPEAGLSDGALQLTAFRMTALAWALAGVSGKAKEPLDRWLAAVQSAVRDEKWLLRMDLEPYEPTGVSPLAASS